MKKIKNVPEIKNSDDALDFLARPDVDAILSNIKVVDNTSHESIGDLLNKLSKLRSEILEKRKAA